MLVFRKVTEEEPCDCAAHAYVGRECTCTCDHVAELAVFS